MVIETSYLDVISSVGFPIFVALWFMMRTEKVIGNNTRALDRVEQIISKCPATK